MPTLPVVRLSKVLYSNAPTVTRSRSAPNTCSPSLKRGHSHASSPRSKVGNINSFEEAPFSAAEVRLLLPSTFSVANRVYHEDVGSIVVGVEEEGKVGALDGSWCCPLQRSGTEIQAYRNNRKCEKNAFDSDGTNRFGCCGINNLGCGSSNERASTYHGIQYHCPDLSASSKLTEEVNVGNGLTVVVESVLGFTALRALLDRSHTTPDAAVKDSPGLEDQPSCFGGSGPALYDKIKNEHRREHFDAGVSEAVGRLVEWLRIEAAREVLRKRADFGGHVDTSKGGTLANTVSKRSKESIGDEKRAGSTTGAVRAEVTDDEDTLAAAALRAVGGCCVGGILYEVTERHADGDEWSTFTLKPAYFNTKGRAIRRRKKSRDSARPTVLQVRVICHPLITMAPDIRWCLRLISQAKAIARLLNANAKLSTLGGGYFLTRQVGQAIRLARAQSEVATALGNLQLAAKCRINEAYNYIWLGHYAKAKRIIQAEIVASRDTHDEEVEKMAVLAAQFLKRSKEANRRLLERDIGDVNGDCHGSRPKWARQIIDVKTDEWHRVRAIPLYNSSSGASPLGR